MNDPADIYSNILLAVKGNVACEQQRKTFAMCRATSVGASGDPSFCDQQAAVFLDCYNKMVIHTQANCQQDLLMAYQCLEEADTEGSLPYLAG